jgi:hypothetical protein
MINPRAAAHIASMWHGGGGSALYSFASTGAITHNTMVEVESDIAEQVQLYIGYGEKENIGHVKELAKLLEYLVTIGERAAQDGWYELAVGQGRG